MATTREARRRAARAVLAGSQAVARSRHHRGGRAMRAHRDDTPHFSTIPPSLYPLHTYPCVSGPKYHHQWIQHSEKPQNRQSSKNVIFRPYPPYTHYTRTPAFLDRKNITNRFSIAKNPKISKVQKMSFFDHTPHTHTPLHPRSKLTSPIDSAYLKTLIYRK